MYGLLSISILEPLAGVSGVVLLAVGVPLAWRLYKYRERRRDYRLRQQARRDYWGFD